MIQPRVMLLRAQRKCQRPGLIEGSISSSRYFSITRTCSANPPSQDGASKTPAASRPRKATIPPANLNSKQANSDKPRPRRIIDARSLAARQNDGQSTNILRSPGFRGTRNSSPTRARKPNAPSKATAPKARKSNRSRPSRNSDKDDSDNTQRAAIENVFQELTEKSKAVPTRYDPQPPNLLNLSETWPSLPTDNTAYSAGVIEKLSLLSERPAAGYIPPHELGKRLFQGKYVQFRSEQEKSEAIAAAKNLSQERADKISQRKGTLVDPSPINFKNMNAENQKVLLESLVQGKYPTQEVDENTKSPVLGEVLKNLRNNETYQATTKTSQFMAKVESLLASSRPAKRV